MVAVRALIPFHLPLFYFSFIILFLSLSYVVVSETETDILLQLKQSLGNPKKLDSWKKGKNPCDVERWSGVMCSHGNVSALHLANLELSGTFDVKLLVNLKSLRAVNIENNSFTGTIPDFNTLGALKALDIQYNQFSGEIPPDYFSSMGSLKKLYLAHNKFTGRISESLTKVQNLVEVYLEHNEFTGPVPLLTQTSLVHIDLSHNKLEGEIPEAMTKFGEGAFMENPDLCSPKFRKECPVKVDPNKSMSSIVWIISCVVITVLGLFLIFRVKSREDYFDVSQKDHLDDVVETPLPTTTKRSPSSNNRSMGNASMRGSRRGSRNERGPTDLVIINEEKGIFGLTDLMKAAAEVLGNGGLGSAYKAGMANGVSVVVKRLRETNKMSRDTFDSEMRRLGNLRHRNILPPLAYHFRREEKLFVSEFVPRGSLMHLLHADKGIPHAELTWPVRLKIIKGVAQGMGFLHKEFASYDLPHGNLKSSNILLGSDHEPLLTDYAFYPILNNTPIVQALFAYKSPEAILYQQVTPKCDVYCLGIVILEIMSGKLPSHYLNNQKGGTDIVLWAKAMISDRKERELIDPEIVPATNSLRQMEKLVHIGADCTESNHDNRIDMKEAIRRIEEIHE